MRRSQLQFATFKTQHVFHCGDFIELLPDWHIMIIVGHRKWIETPVPYSNVLFGSSFDFLLAF